MWLPAMKIWKATQNVKILVLSHPFEDSGITLGVHLYGSMKSIVDLQLAIIDLFPLALTAEALLS